MQNIKETIILLIYTNFLDIKNWSAMAQFYFLVVLITENETGVAQRTREVNTMSENSSFIFLHVTSKLFQFTILNFSG